MRLRACVLASIATLSVVLYALPAGAQGEPAFSLDAARVETPPVLDGTLNDPSWQKAAHVQLTWDIAFQRPAAESTDAYLLIDDKFLYVAFVAKQNEPISATQRSNNIGLSSDDAVGIYVWPGGDKGFEYFFSSNPIGTRYCYSSENTAFAPAWTSVGKPTSDGYVVTARIPLDVMRGDGRSIWRLQFDRRVRRSDRIYEWAHADGQSYPDASFYAGYLNGMSFASTTTRTKPRVAIYALAQRASPAGGGSTSRMGADFSVPITQSASFFGTLHPDYSNVELDQQTISPTAFQRQFQEVRPFFSQGTNVYNDFNCNDCTIYPWLYTPNIPTPGQGYAVEGVQGPVSLAAFTSRLASRSDAAQAVNVLTNNQRIKLVVLHESVNEPGLTDQLTLGQLRYGNIHNFSLYTTQGVDRGTNVSDPSLGNYREYGVNLFTPKSGIFPAWRSGGAQFNPLDSFVPLTDVTGPSVYAYREFDPSASSYIRKITLSEDIQRYHNGQGQTNETNTSTSIAMDTRNLFTFNAFLGSSWLLLNGQGGYTNQNGFSLSYASRTSTPTSFSHYFGSYGTGYLNATNRSVTFKVGPRATSTVEADDNNFRPAGSPRLTQWLERVSLAYQIGSESSISAGVRRTIGTGPYFGVPPQYVNAFNISSAYYRRFGHSEIYLVYGNPNSVATTPAVILKYILYLGAEKGT